MCESADLHSVLLLTHSHTRVLNGDLITGESDVFRLDVDIDSCFTEILSNLDTFRENSTTLIDEIVAPLNKFKIPFSSSHGVRILSSGRYGALTNIRITTIRLTSRISKRSKENRWLLL